jgi:cystathionine beta-lyase
MKFKEVSFMPINFDEIIDRKNTNSLKYDFAAERNKPEGLLPMWVADMDFKVYQPILDDLHATIDHGIFGYSEAKNNYFISLHNWFHTHFSGKPNQNG